MKAAVRIRVARLEHAADLPLPAYASAGSAGLDLRAAITGEIELAPAGRAMVPTGLVLEIPPGYEGQVRPRSGLAIRHGVTMANPPGTIDSDFRGELQVLLVNLGEEPFTLRRGDRVAQLVVAPVTRIEWDETANLSPTGRGIGGFGSTGLA